VADLQDGSDEGSLERLLARTPSLGQDGAAARELRQFVLDSDLVSMDTVQNRLRSLGAGGPLPVAYKRRLLSRYYRANVDHRFAVPGAAGLTSDRAIDALDADLFWGVFARLFGDEAASRLSSAYTFEFHTALWTLREDEGWLEFRRQYFSLLDAINETLLADPDGVVAELRLVLGLSRFDVPRRLWREQKLAITSAVLAGAITAAAPPVGAPLIAAVVITGLLGVGDLARSVRRFVAEFQALPVNQLEGVIRREVRDAARRLAARRK
jgi:hypothetical protein